MKKISSFLFFALMAVVFIPACQQDELINAPVESKKSILIIRSELKNLGDSILVAKIASDEYTKSSSSLKSGKKSKMGLIRPNNDLYNYPNGNIRQVWPWVITAQNGSNAIDQGVIIVDYDDKYEITSWEFHFKWDNNEYCRPIWVNTNAKNQLLKLNFNYQVVGGGELSYPIIMNCEDQAEVWLPLTNYNLNWETTDGARFGGVINFDSEHQTHVNIVIGDKIDINTFDYIKFETNGVRDNSKILFSILDKDRNYSDEAEILFPKGKEIPAFVMIPLTFSPGRVSYQTVSYESGMAENEDWVYKHSYLIETENDRRIWGLE